MREKLKKSTSLIIILCLVLSVFGGSAYAAHRYFEDAKGHWAEDAIKTLTEQGVIAGFPDGLCHPDETITRAEFTTLLARTMTDKVKAEKNGEVFYDIKGHWAEQSILYLVERKIIDIADYKNKLFVPNEPITRLEMVKMLVRVLGDNCHSKGCACNLDFTDINLLRQEDKLYLCIGKEYFIIKGYPDKTVKPYGDATRAEAFEMLVKQKKAKDKIQQEKPSSGGNGGGGSSYVPAPQFSFTLPENSYVGNEVKITGQAQYVSSVTWRVTKNEIPVELSSVFDGELNEDGGTLKAKERGKYTITATAKNSRGKEVNYSQTVTVYPVITMDFTLPKTAHTDTAIAVDLKTENLDQNTVVWSVAQDDMILELEKAISGELTNTGGTVQFKEKGSYTLTAKITDEIGKETTVSKNIVIYPVAEIKLALPTISHIDKTVTLYTENKNTEGLTVAWTLTKDCEPVEIKSQIEGDVSLFGSNIRFKEKGVYQLTVTLTDKTGRAFTDTVKIIVYPVGAVGFYLPSILHTDDTVKVETTLSEIGNKNAVWTVTKNGKEIPLSDAITGTLTNEGGNIRFKDKGEYILKCSFTDDGGRAYSYEQAAKVYPVPTVTYTQTKLIHTDTEIAINTTVTDLDGLTLEWLVDNTFGYQDFNTFVSGSLTNNGGNIHFKRAGIYELVARTTDETGRVFLFEPKNKTEVLPVLTLSFDLPEVAYTDTQIGIRTSGHNNTLPIEWTLTKDGESVAVSSAVIGELNKLGGKVRFTSHGEYVLTSTMTDLLGRSYSHSESIAIMPIIEYGFTMPSEVYYGKAFEVKISKSQYTEKANVVWTLSKNGETRAYVGELSKAGGTIAIKDIGEFVLTAIVTDTLGRECVCSHKISVTNTIPTISEVTASPTRTVKDGKFLVDISAVATDADGDSITLEWQGRTDGDYYTVGTHTIKVRAKDIAGAYSEWASKTFTVMSNKPTVTLTATPTRTVKNGKFLVNISTTSNDADEDTVTLEWENKATDSYYAEGTHTVRVRAKDSTGAYSDWVSKTFTIANSVPTRPVITRTPNGNSVTPGTAITITASSTDPDGDSITYVWENRPAQSYIYPLGKNVVRVKAVDSTGAESPWAAIVFFVSDSSGSGGMTLTGPDSTILENGIEGATITKYTFTVPPVDGHSGNDFGRVRGYNMLTKQWDQLDYETTTNGITFKKNLNSGLYSKLEFYYYTNHNCMYGKSNITYSVEYFFE